MKPGESLQCTAGVQSARPTVVLFSAEREIHIPEMYLNAALAVAKAADVDFLYCSSQPIDIPLHFERQANLLYTLFDAANVDGILIATNLIGLYHSVSEIRTFFQRYQPVPVVSMGGILEGIPSLITDNFTGMYAAVTHLLETHGYRRIAFLGGLRESQEAQERYRAYTTALHDHGIPLDEGLVIHGNFRRIFGPKAVQIWLDERGYRPHGDIEAIVAANDYMAIGVLLELQKRGIAVPEEVAIVGFDDVVIGRTFTPPLTTVHQPFEEIGRRAMEFLLARMQGQPAPQATLVPAQLVVRQSCGCPKPEARSAGGERHDLTTAATMLLTSPRQFFHQINQAISAPEITVIVGKMDTWAQALSLLREDQSGRKPDAATGFTGDSEASLQMMLAEMMLFTLQEKRESQILNQLGERIILTLNITELMDVLAEELPRLSIHSGYVVLYDDPPAYQFPQTLPPSSRFVLAYNREGLIALPPSGLQFPTHDLFLQPCWSAEQAQGMVMISLFFQREQIGFALLEAGASEVSTYSTLRRYLSTSLHGNLLVHRVQQHTATLEAANRELRDFAYVVSHDLKAPLRGIAHLAQWLGEDYGERLDGEGHDMLTLLVGRVKRLENLIEGILEYSRIGRTNTDEVQVDLQHLVPAVIDSLSAPDHIQITISGMLPVIRANPTRILQVFQNLISNAIKYLDKPRGAIMINCEDTGNTWLFRITDNGPGIDARHHERIFKIFQTLTPRDQRESTGIGLTLVKKIVTLYGGAVGVESTAGEGSTFWFTLPKSLSESPKAPKHA